MAACSLQTLPLLTQGLGTAAKARAHYHPLQSAINSGREVEQRGHRQPHHVEIVALDPRHERGPAPLDRVCAGAALPLPRAHVCVDRRAVQRPELHHGLRGGGADPVSIDEADAADDHVARAAERGEHLGGVLGIAGLAEDLRPQAHHGVDARDGQLRGRRSPRPCDRRSPAPPRRRAPRRARARPGSGPRTPPRSARGWRVAAVRPTRGSGSRRRQPAALVQARSPKNSPTSRSADSGASEPWTMFWPTEIA